MYCYGNQRVISGKSCNGCQVAFSIENILTDLHCITKRGLTNTSKDVYDENQIGSKSFLENRIAICYQFSTV